MFCNGVVGVGVGVGVRVGVGIDVMRLMSRYRGLEKRNLVSNGTFAKTVAALSLTQGNLP